MKFWKKFLENLWALIRLLFFLILGVIALLAPFYLAALFDDRKWLLLYLVYGIPLLAFIATWEDMKNGDY